MKKKLSFSIIFLIAFSAGLIYAENNEFIRLTDLRLSYPNGISPNGRYIAGWSIDGGFLYDVTTHNHILLSDALDALDVTSDKTVVGHFRYNFPVDESTSKPIQVAGIWENGSWTSLGIGDLTKKDLLEDQDGSQAFAISSDKKKVGGALISMGQSYTTPCVWAKNEDGTWSCQTYSTPYDDFRPYRNGKIHALSGDGSIAAGLSLNNHGGLIPTVWKSPTEYVLAEESLANERAYHISENGKYVSMSCGWHGTLYSVEDDSYKTIPSHPGATMSTILGVANDGMVVGCSRFSGYRLGYVYSEKLGFMDLADYIDAFAPDVNTGNMDFRSHGFFIVPMDISADGKVITGWYGTGVYDMTTWILKLAEKPSVLSMPQNLQISVSKHKTVTLTWDAPENVAGYTLTGYNIYRNNVLLDSIIGEDRTYTYEEAIHGKQAYVVSAVHGDGMSPKTDPVYADIYDMTLPFFEDFDSGSFSTNFWSRDPERNSMWFLLVSSPPFGVRGLYDLGATFISPPDLSGSYSLITKDFYADEAQEVYLKFALKYFIERPATTKESLHVEIQTDSEWETVKSYTVPADATYYKTYGWSVETVDLSSKVAGKEFRLRFRIVGESTEQNTWDLDNIRIDFTPVSNEADVPAKPSGKISGKTVALEWKSLAGSDELTYFNGVANAATGNEGVPFIAANAFKANAMAPYLGRYLSSVSAFIRQTDLDTDHRLGLFVLYGNNKIYREIESYVPNAWNTFLLETPLLLSEIKDLKFGIDIIEHQLEEMPIGNDASRAINADGNVFSEDGLVWEKLSMYGVENNWAIVGNITDENNTTMERNPSFMAYILHRDGQPVNNVIYQLKYTDTEADVTKDHTYALSAYYNDGTESALSDSFALMTGAPTITEEQETNVYPNPSSDFIRISGSFSKATLIDSAGKPVLETTENPVSIAYLPSGIYLLKIESGTQVTICKVLKK